MKKTLALALTVIALSISAGAFAADEVKPVEKPAAATAEKAPKKAHKGHKGKKAKKEETK